MDDVPMMSGYPDRSLLVLDIDETLLYTQERPTVECEFYLDAGPGPLGCNALGVRRRPGLDTFLAWCFAQSFATAIWTAGNRAYADEIVARIFTPEQRDALAFVWARDRCTRAWKRPEEHGYYIDDDGERFELLKSLKKVKRAGWDLARVLHVDNTPAVARRNFGNLVVIPTWTGNPADRCLELLPAHLSSWFAEPDVRPIEKRGWWRTTT